MGDLGDEDFFFFGFFGVWAHGEIDLLTDMTAAHFFAANVANATRGTKGVS